jgi:hypothetical protein
VITILASVIAYLLASHPKLAASSLILTIIASFVIRQNVGSNRDA